MEVVAPLLRALGVRESFGPNDFINTLASLEPSQGNTALNTDQLGLAVGMCKLLARVNPTERKKLKANRLKVMAPDVEGRMAKVQVMMKFKKMNRHIHLCRLK